MSPTRVLAPLTVTGALLLTGCGARTTGDAAAGGAGDGSDRPTVVTSFYPLQYVAERVAGEHAAVENLTSPGVEPHDLELTVPQTAALADADLVVYEQDMQPAVDEAVERTGPANVLEVTEVVDLLPAEEPEEAGDEHAGESAEEHAEHAENGDLDPHFWLDPERMATLTGAVADALAEADPENAADYRANAEGLQHDLAEVDTAYREGLEDCERDIVVVSHDAFGYLGKYGLHLEPIAGLSPDAEPSASHLAELSRLVEREGLTTVFSETLASPALAETLARDLGVETAVLDPIEGLGEQTADEDYLSLMRANLAALQKANGCR